MITLQPIEVLQTVEKALSRHRAFGDSDYIHNQFRQCSKERLGVVGKQLPGANRLLSALQQAAPEAQYRVMGNTAIRSAIQHAQVQVETGEAYGLSLDECESLFMRTAEHIEAGHLGTPFESGGFEFPRIAEQPGCGWIWREEYPNNVFGRSYRRLIQDNWGGSLTSPSETELNTIRQATELLHTLLPELTPSALSHVHIVGLFDQGGGWKRTASSSQIRVGGSIFLARSLLRSPWVLAEHLLHEALHHKLYDFRHGHTLLVTDSEEMNRIKILSPWNPDELTQANHWDAHRAFAALHVYVQLCVLSQLAQHRRGELEPKFGPTDGLIAHQVAYVRARYLGEQLKDKCWDLLGLGGKRMLDWLNDILDVLETSPPPRGADLHLVLDLYRREARGMRTSASGTKECSPAFTDVLESMAQDEIATTRQVLQSAATTAAVSAFDQKIEAFKQGKRAAQFYEVREVISQALLDATPDGYGLVSIDSKDASDTKQPDAVVRDMVESGSRRLYVTVNDIPQAVAAAMQRVHEQCFYQSCVEDVGRFLAVMAAGVPTNGRILEIGTGVGLGTAWLTVGAMRRTDVEIVSVEIDAALHNAAKTYAWPKTVSLIQGNLLELKESLGTFDLVFIDASPIKHGHLEAALDLVGPNGRVVIDDVHVNADPTGESQALQSKLRHTFANHPDFVAVNLDWASGVLLATRTQGGLQ